MIWIFDLDHTLLNTDLLKEDLAASFGQHGVPDDVFWQTLRPSYDCEPESLGSYSISKHLRFLGAAAGSLGSQAVEETLRAHAKARGGYAYPDAMAVLQRLAASGDAPYVVTLGNAAFQDLKIDVSGLRPLLTGVRCTALHQPNQGKIPLIETLVRSGEPFTHVNDSSSEVAAVAAAFPRVTSFIVRPPDRPIQGHGPWTVVNNLTAVLEAVGVG